MQEKPTPQASRILDCAQALISTGGYNGFSYADISAQVGITKASIHHHFPKKTDLVLTLLQRYRADAAEGMGTLTAKIPGPRERLEAYVGWWSACISDATRPICICAMLAAETPALPKELTDEVRLYFVDLAGWIEGALSAGAVSGALQFRAAPAEEAQAFMATVHGAMLSARAYGTPALFEKIVRSALGRLV